MTMSTYHITDLRQQAVYGHHKLNLILASAVAQQQLYLQ
jgi:hypothetical protein